MAHFDLNEVLFVPNAVPPHKSGVTATPFGARYRMVELACAGEPGFVASRIEEGTLRSYSIHTIEKLRAARPSDELLFLIGADAFAEIQTWFRWQDVIAAVEFIVVTRPGHEYTVPQGARVRRLDTLALPVSSSDIREALARGEEPPTVPPPVIAYIREHGLYGKPGPAPRNPRTS